ncbi:MAG: ATPase [Oribacterium parvum]|uniref:ATP-binding protein n=1 Tax=Oribacterium parvum TaxID=1501329 RepID=UPI001CB0C14D|nr:ATP-binding protein [Oribacterium parvum]MBF1269410.1 ATPase [Oribacterium parvum]
MSKIREISPEEWEKEEYKNFTAIDIRDEAEYELGHIDNALWMSISNLLREDRALDKSKAYLLYCKYGTISRELGERLLDEGYHVANLSGGYGQYILMKIKSASEDERREEIEKSLRKKFKKSIFTPFAKAINDFALIQEGDNICVCISGGKDSMIMAKLFQELKRHNKFPFSVQFLCMDPGYNEYNRKIIEENAKLLGIPLHFFESDIFESVFAIESSPCYVCARMRRGHLYSKAKELGCNKIALGHHFDDVIETVLMGMLYSGQFQAMMPKLHSTNFPGMELIRPLYYVREDDIKHWRDYNKLNFIQCACKFTETCSTCHTDGTTSSKRLETKKLIAELKKTNPFIEKNIFRSTENVSKQTILGLKDKGIKHSFLEWYDEE